MLADTADNLDELIHEEKHRVAHEFFNEAWSAALQEGIEPSIAVESALGMVLGELQRLAGDDAVSSVIDALPARAEAGHFHLDRTLQ